MDLNITTVQTVPSFGKGLVPTRDVSPGDVLIHIEKPYLLVVEKDALSRVCSNCLLDSDRSSGNNISLKFCARCKTPRYCSRECQRDHWKASHSKECAILKNLHRIPPTPVRALMQLLLRGGKDGRPWTQLMAHNHKLKEDQKKWEDMCLQAQAATDFAKVSEFEIITALDILCRMTTNAFRATLADDTPVGLCFEPILAMANHSCTPNGYVTFDGQAVELRALDTIKKGEQIFISYVDTTHKFESRQNALRSQYFFTCQCPACISRETPYHSFLRQAPDSSGKIQSVISTETLIATSKAMIETLKKFNVMDKRNTREPMTLIQSITHNASLNLVVGAMKGPDQATRHAEIYAIMQYMIHAFGRNHIFAIQPFPNMLQEIFHHYLTRGSLFLALCIAIFTYFNVDVYTYPQPNHPIRVVRMFTISKLLLSIMNDLAENDNGMDMIPGPYIDKVMDELDLVDAYHATLIIVHEYVGQSHGLESRFGQLVVSELTRARNANGARIGYPAGAKLERWDEGGIKEAERIFGTLRKLATWKALMEVMDDDGVGMDLRSPVAHGEPAVCTAE